MTVVFCPSFATAAEAVAWFAERGYSTPKLWRGPDGLIRGSAAK